MTWSLNSRSNRAPCFSYLSHFIWYHTGHCIFSKGRTQAGIKKKRKQQPVIAMWNTFPSFQHFTAEIFYVGSFSGTSFRTATKERRTLRSIWGEACSRKCHGGHKWLTCIRSRRGFPSCCSRTLNFTPAEKKQNKETKSMLGEKTMPFSAQLCWLSTNFLEMEPSTFLDLWTLTHLQQEAQILSIVVLSIMTNDVFLLAPLKAALWLPAWKHSPKASTKPRNQTARPDDDKGMEKSFSFPKLPSEWQLHVNSRQRTRL